MENTLQATFTNVAQQAWDIRKLRMQYEKKEKELFDILKSLSQEQNFSAGGFLFSVNSRLGSIDYSIIPELKGVDLEIYRKASTKTFKLEKE